MCVRLCVQYDNSTNLRFKSSDDRWTHNTRDLILWFRLRSYGFEIPGMKPPATWMQWRMSWSSCALLATHTICLTTDVASLNHTLQWWMDAAECEWMKMNIESINRHKWILFQKKKKERLRSFHAKAFRFLSLHCYSFRVKSLNEFFCSVLFLSPYYVSFSSIINRFPCEFPASSYVGSLFQLLYFCLNSSAYHFVVHFPVVLNGSFLFCFTLFLLSPFIQLHYFPFLLLLSIHFPPFFLSFRCIYVNI